MLTLERDVNMDLNELNVSKYDVFIHPADLRELRRDIWIDEPVPGKLKYKNKLFIIGIAYRGNHIRDYEKKSYTLDFVKPKNFHKHTQLHLNAEFIDPSLIRNNLSFSFFEDIGVLAPQARYLNLHINGNNEGIYLALESVDKAFFTKRNLSVTSIYYAVDDDANFNLINPFDYRVKESMISGYARKYGTFLEDSYLSEFIYKANTLSSAEFAKEIINYINIDQVLRWLAGVVCTQNYDGFVHNYTLYRNGDNGLFEILPWDYDATWGRDCNGEIMKYDTIPIEGDHANILTLRLLEVPEFRYHYRSILEEILKHQFTPDALTARITSLHKLLRPYVQDDPYHQKYLFQFDNEPKYMLKFVSDRNHYLLENMSKLN